MPKILVKNVTPNGYFDTQYGRIYKFVITSENPLPDGKFQAVYHTKQTEQKHFKIGEEIEVIYEMANNPQYLGKIKPAFTKVVVKPSTTVSQSTQQKTPEEADQIVNGLRAEYKHKQNNEFDEEQNRSIFMQVCYNVAIKYLVLKSVTEEQIIKEAYDIKLSDYFFGQLYGIVSDTIKHKKTEVSKRLAGSLNRAMAYFEMLYMHNSEFPFTKEDIVKKTQDLFIYFSKEIFKG